MQAAHAAPKGSEFAHNWTHEQGMVFLNHGSFGGCPRAVLDAQSEFRSRMESEPVRFFVEQLQGLMDETRDAVAGFVDCDWDCLAFLPNATTGVAVALENVRLQPGDEILVNDHEYPACLNNVRRIAARTGAKVVKVTLPWPLPKAGARQSIIDAILGGITPRTKVALVSHVTSPSALVLPIEQLIPVFKQRGILSLIDGAHAPGMIGGLSIRRLDPDFYTANCHKWTCSPKGSALLYVRKELRDGFRPLVLSNNAELPKPGRPQFLTEFDYIGTGDYSAILSIPAALRTMGGFLPGGFSSVMRRNRELALRARALINEHFGNGALAPDDMIGSIAAMLLPARGDGAPPSTRPPTSRYGDPLQERLIDKWKIQVPVWGVPGTPQRVLRISAQLYNSFEQYEYLLQALKEELASERRAPAAAL
ncbi:MAG: aminotransferase class V-fold PLP-dependent enzyme [Phycisphaeraceae bacterium]|nr:aminotransferase class V-fold PLP-dependent enzyme [Phycisphaeraceae bacterium]